VSAFSNKFWKKLCSVLQLKELADEEDFSSPEKRMLNKDRLLPFIEKAFREKTTSEWLNLLGREELPHGPIYTYEQMFNDEALRIAEYLVEFLHPVAGTTWAMGMPIKGLPPEETPNGPAPLLGEHTDEVLSGLGFSIEEMDRLKEKRIVGYIGEA
jgi:CoA:oxalate CoA-transferase